MTELRETYFQYLERVAPDDYRPSIALAEMIADAMTGASQDVLSRLHDDSQVRFSAVMAIAMGAMQSALVNSAIESGATEEQFITAIRDTYDSRQAWRRA